MALAELKNVSRVYESGDHQLKALDDVTVNFDEGKFIVILGPSGAGKSTLLNLLGGLDSPTSGTITVCGKDISRLTSDELAKYRAETVGFVFQFYNLIPTLTVKENVELVKEISKDALNAEDMIKEVGLSDHLNNFPAELSGGEITVSPYGTDKKYNLKIAGIIRSVVENAVITVNYADSLNIDYKLTNVYTNVKSDLINKNAIISNVQSKSDLMASFDSFMGMMYASITLLIVAGMVLGFIVLYNLGVMSYTERYREMATLKVVGFKDKKIGSLLISQSLWVTLIGTIIGLPLGYATLSYLFTQLASEYEMQAKVSALSVLISAALAFLVTLAVSFALAKKNKKINMVESLKCAE